MILACILASLLFFAVVGFVGALGLVWTASAALLEFSPAAYILLATWTFMALGQWMFPTLNAAPPVKRVRTVRAKKGDTTVTDRSEWTA